MTDFPSMDGKICLVTGATSGIGQATAARLAALGATVIVSGRNPEKTAAVRDEIRSASGNPQVHALLADFGDLQQVRALETEFRQRFERLDVLVNNAGTVLLRREETPLGVEKTFLVNHLAPFLLTNLLLDTLQAAPAGRIINVSSEAHRAGSLDLNDLAWKEGYSGIKAYRRSKLANVLFTRELARRLADTPVTANAMHPGTVATGIWKTGFRPLDRFIQRLVRFFMLSPEAGADTVLYMAASPAVDGVSGKYFIKRRPVPVSRAGRDEALARDLWQVSEKLVGLAL